MFREIAYTYASLIHLDLDLDLDCLKYIKFIIVVLHKPIIYPFQSFIHSVQKFLCLNLIQSS